MLGWDELHPYNAVHVLRIPHPLDPERLKRVVDGTLDSLGLTNLVISPDRHELEFEGGPATHEIKIVSPDPSPGEALRIQTERHLNTRFICAGRFSPFRFFVVPDENGFFLGLAYFHAVADAVATLHVLRLLTGWYVSDERTGEVQRFEIYPRDRNRSSARVALGALRKIVAIPSMIGQMRRSHQPRCADAKDLSNALTLFPLPEAALPNLQRASRAWDVTINDLFLALLLRCLSPLAAERTKRERRRQIALGTIINTRNELGLNGRAVFGLFLGSFAIHHEAPDDMPLRDLATQVHGQTSRIKRRKPFLSTAELSISRFLLSFYSTEKRKKLYQKHYPLWGGITNMNLNAIWKQNNAGPDYYVRTVSTGPVTPLVLSVTTVRDRINGALSYRPAVFSREDIFGIQTRLIDLICGLEATAE
jgi:hypothetical protein